MRADPAVGVTAGALGPAVAARAPPGVQTRIAEEGCLTVVTAMDDSALHGVQLHAGGHITSHRNCAMKSVQPQGKGGACDALHETDEPR